MRTNPGSVRGSDYDGYIREDLSSRVFVDFEVFMKSVLHVPEDWKTLWGPAIEAVKADQNFKDYHKDYCRQCAKEGTLEKPFYKPLMNTANAVLDVLSQPPFDDISGIPSALSCQRSKGASGWSHEQWPLSRPGCFHKAKNLHWANALHILEVKPFDSCAIQWRENAQIGCRR
jgi:hypothetical protein